MYNVQDYLAVCLDSLLAQLPTTAQVVMVNNGSTDRSGEICEEYARRYPQLCVIHQENSGVSGARNTALAHATGEYLLWVDPDDWVAPDWFARIDREVCEYAPDLIQFDYTEWEDGKCRLKSYGAPAGQVDTHQYLMDIVRDIRLNSTLWSKAFKRSLFDGIRFDLSLQCLEDYAILHHVILRARNIRYISEALYYYRIRSTSLVRTLNLDVAFASYEVAVQRLAELTGSIDSNEMNGVLLQARSFLRNFYLAGSPEKYRPQFRTCRKVILTNALGVLREREQPLSFRVKTLLLCVPGSGRLMKKPAK